MRQPTLNEKAAATIEDLELMASLHRTNGDDAAAEEFDDFGMVVRQLVAENEALRKRIDDMSPFKGAPFTGPDTKCLACGGYHYGMGGLPCPKMSITAQALSMENQRITPVEPIRAPHPLDAAMGNGGQP